jgi:hypothetical protein
LAGIGVQAAPDVDAEPRRGFPAQGRGGREDLSFRLGEAAGGAEHAQPAVAERRGAPDRGFSLAADDHRNRGLRGRQDPGVLEVEELALMADLLTGQQPAD